MSKIKKLLIVFVQKGGIADKKFLIGDVIKSVNGVTVTNRIELDNEVNKIDWSWGPGSQFEGMVITTDGTIMTGSKVQKRLVTMILFWILGTSKFV